MQNRAPTADPGPDRTILDGGPRDLDGQRDGEATIRLYGSNSTDPDASNVGTQIICSGISTDSVPDESLSFDWYMGNSSATPAGASHWTGVSPVVTGIPEGRTTFTLTVRDACGQSDAAEIDILVGSSAHELANLTMAGESAAHWSSNDFYEQTWDGKPYLETRDPLARIHGVDTSNRSSAGFVELDPISQDSPVSHNHSTLNLTVLGDVTNEEIRFAMDELDLTSQAIKEAINQSLGWQSSNENIRQAALKSVDEGDYTAAAAALTGTILDVRYYCGEDRGNMHAYEWVMIIPQVLDNCDGNILDDDAVVNMLPTRIGLCSQDPLFDGLDATLFWAGIDGANPPLITGFKYMGHNLGVDRISSTSVFTGDFSLHGLCGNNILEDQDLCPEIEPGSAIGDELIIDDGSNLEEDVALPQLCHSGIEGSIEIQFYRNAFHKPDRLVYTKGGWMTKGKTGELVFDPSYRHEDGSNDHQRLDFKFQDTSNGWNLKLGLHDERAYDRLEGSLRLDDGRRVNLEFCKDVSWGDHCRFPSTSFVTIGYGKLDNGASFGGEKHTLKVHFETGTSGLKDSIIQGTFSKKDGTFLERWLNFLIKGLPERNYLRIDSGEDPETSEIEDQNNVTSMDLTKKEGKNFYRTLLVNGINSPYLVDMSADQVMRYRFAKAPEDIRHQDGDAGVTLVSALHPGASSANAMFNADKVTSDWESINITLEWLCKQCSPPIYTTHLDCGPGCLGSTADRDVNEYALRDDHSGNLWAQANTENYSLDTDGGLEFQEAWGTNWWPCVFHEGGLCS